MPYNKRNRLYRIKDIQEIVKKYYPQGMSYTRIYQEFIRDRYHISKRTFDAYLRVNVEEELKKLDEIENKQRENKKN